MVTYFSISPDDHHIATQIKNAIQEHFPDLIFTSTPNSSTLQLVIVDKDNFTPDLSANTPTLLVLIDDTPHPVSMEQYQSVRVVNDDLYDLLDAVDSGTRTRSGFSVWLYVIITAVLFGIAGAITGEIRIDPDMSDESYRLSLWGSTAVVFSLSAYMLSLVLPRYERVQYAGIPFVGTAMTFIAALLGHAGFGILVNLVRVSVRVALVNQPEITWLIYFMLSFGIAFSFSKYNPLAPKGLNAMQVLSLTFSLMMIYGANFMFRVTFIIDDYMINNFVMTATIGVVWSVILYGHLASYDPNQAETKML